VIRDVCVSVLRDMACLASQDILTVQDQMKEHILRQADAFSEKLLVKIST